MLRELRMRAAYRPGLARADNPAVTEVLSDFADGAFDQRFVFKDRDRSCVPSASGG